MKISGKEIADSILKKLQQEIKKENLTPSLAIILAGDNPSSKVYVSHKLKTAGKFGIHARLLEFKKNEKEKLLDTIEKLNNDKDVHGIIVQFPVYQGWNFDEISQKINPQKDVDGFEDDSPYQEATALAVWEMLSAFARHEKMKVAQFLKGKKITVLGKGRTAGGPIIKLLNEKNLDLGVVDKDTKNPNIITKNADIIISATGVKNIVNGSNIKKGSYVIGVGVGKEIINGEEKIYGDINEAEVSKKAKLYCPTIGGIGPLTIACLLRNVVESSKKEKVKSKNGENL